MDGSYVDPVIEAYRKDMDRTHIRENLRFTPDQRLKNLEATLADALEFRHAMKATKARR